MLKYIIADIKELKTVFIIELAFVLHRTKTKTYPKSRRTIVKELIRYEGLGNYFQRD